MEEVSFPWILSWFDLIMLQDTESPAGRSEMGVLGCGAPAEGFRGSGGEVADSGENGLLERHLCFRVVLGLFGECSDLTQLQPQGLAPLSPAGL